MPRTTLLAVAVALAVDAALPAFAAGPTPERFGPLKTLQRFLPESLPKLEYPAYYGDLEKARALMHQGRYVQAIYACTALTDADVTVDVSLIRGESLWRTGRVQEARKTLIATDDPRVALLLARIDLDSGNAQAAIDRLTPLVEASPDSVAPRHWLAIALERAGRLSDAVEQHRHFAEGDSSLLATFERDGALGFESAEDLTLAAASIDRWAAVTMAYAKRQELHDIVLRMFVEAADTVDREYWPAHVAAAHYLFEYGNKKQATEELDAANAINPNAFEVNALLGEMASAARGDGIDAAVKALRDVDPTSFSADLLSAQADIQRRGFASALATAQRCVERQPTNIDALAVLACAYAASGQTDAMNATLARVDAINPLDATARQVVAGTLTTVYYDSAGAVEMLQEATRRAPWWTAPQHALGVALIQEGEEEQARVVLSGAYDVDPYNLLTVNYLRVLDELSKFKQFESERFIFKYAEQDDPIVPLYLAPQMDAMYDDLVKQFGYEPPRKPIIEVFPDTEGFSVRTAGQVGLETYGASLGRVMTVVAPRAGDTLGPFNWPRVLRHEFTHTLNLMYTRGRVPRWLTEGIAVWQEHVPYRFPEVPEQLYKIASEGKMATPGDMRVVRSEMHYMTGFWIVRYIHETHGWDALLNLLKAYRDGKEDDDAFRAAVGDDVATFHKKFSAWAKEQVNDWGYDEATAKIVKTTQEQADQLIRDGQDDQAIEKWKEIAKLQPMNPLPNRRLAGLYLRQEKPTEALPYLIATLPLELQDDRYAKRIARTYDAAGDAANAMKYANAAIGINPYDPDAHELLAVLHDKAGDAEAARREREVAALLTKRAKKPATPAE